MLHGIIMYFKQNKVGNSLNLTCQLLCGHHWQKLLKWFMI